MQIKFLFFNRRAHKIFLISLFSFFIGNILFYIFDNFIKFNFFVELIFLYLVLQNFFLLVILKIFSFKLIEFLKFFFTMMSGRFFEYLLYKLLINTEIFDNQICFIISISSGAIVKNLLIYRNSKS